MPGRLTARRLLGHNGHRSRGHASLLGNNQINKSPCVVPQQCAGTRSCRQIRPLHASTLMNGAGKSYQHIKTLLCRPLCTRRSHLAFRLKSRVTRHDVIVRFTYHRANISLYTNNLNRSLLLPRSHRYERRKCSHLLLTPMPKKKAG